MFYSSNPFGIPSPSSRVDRVPPCPNFKRPPLRPKTHGRLREKCFATHLPGTKHTLRSLRVFPPGTAHATDCYSPVGPVSPASAGGWSARSSPSALEPQRIGANLRIRCRAYASHPMHRILCTEQLGLGISEQIPELCDFRVRHIQTDCILGTSRDYLVTA